MYWRNDNTTTGQFQQEDRKQIAAGDGNYRRPMGNDPTNATDPSGLHSIDMNSSPSLSGGKKLVSFHFVSVWGAWANEWSAFIGIYDPANPDYVTRVVDDAKYKVKKEELDATTTYIFKLRTGADWDDFFRHHGEVIDTGDAAERATSSNQLEARHQAVPGGRRDWKEGMGWGKNLGAVAITWTAAGPSFVSPSGDTFILSGGKWTNAATKAAATSAEESAADAAMLATQGGLDANKLHHIFDDATHNLAALVAEFRTQQTAFQAIQRETEAVVQAKNITGLFEEQVTVGSQTITVSGKVTVLSATF
jgi:hypothetical protein